MRVLLISMPDNIPLFNCYHGYIHNLGLRSLAGNLDIEGVEVKILDLIFFCKCIRRIIKKALEEYKPQVVGLSAMTFQYNTAKRVAQFIKAFDRNIKIVIGGYHATLMYDEIYLSPESAVIDFIVRGEGERTFRELIENLLLSKPRLHVIDGLSFKDGNGFMHNKPRALLELAQIKLPKRTGVDLFKPDYGVFKKLGIVETTRGCTYGCNFCSIRHMYGASFRKFKIERVIQDIKNAKESGAIRILFADDNITLNVGNLKNLCDAIVDNRLNDIRYSTQANVKGIAADEELSEKLSRANFNAIFMGIENPLKRNIQGLNKSQTAENSRRAVQNLHKHNIAVMGGFITANPDDTKDDIDAVFKFSNELGCDVLMLQMLTPYPKTEVREMLAQSKMITNYTDYSKYNGFHCNVRTRYLKPWQVMWCISIGNILWYLRATFNVYNWFNRSERVLPHVRRRLKLMTLNLIWQFALGRYGKSSHKF